jgi:hypothetical protein
MLLSSEMGTRQGGAVSKKHMKPHNDWEVFDIRIKKTAGNFCIAIYYCMDFSSLSILHT